MAGHVNPKTELGTETCLLLLPQAPVRSDGNPPNTRVSVLDGQAAEQ